MGTWKSYLHHLLANYGGLFLCNCNFDVKDFSIHSQFYTELLHWLSDFREDFASNKDWNNIIWNNKEIRVNGSPVYYKNYFDSNLFYVSDLLFYLNSTESFDVIAKKIRKTNFLVWTGLHYSVPNYLKSNIITATPSPLCFIFWHDSMLSPIEHSLVNTHLLQKTMCKLEMYNMYQLQLHKRFYIQCAF